MKRRTFITQATTVGAGAALGVNLLSMASSQGIKLNFPAQFNAAHIAHVEALKKEMSLGLANAQLIKDLLQPREVKHCEVSKNGYEVAYVGGENHLVTLIQRGDRVITKFAPLA